MSSFIANALLYVITATATDNLGDVVDSAVVIPPNAATLAIPASVIERSRKVYVPESGELRTVRWYAGRVSNAHLGQTPQGARLYDLKSQRTYIVDEVLNGARSITGAVEQTLDLRRVEPTPA